jgi:hypothetical protein
MSVQSCVAIRSQILQQLSAMSGNGIEDMALSVLALRKDGVDPRQLLAAQHRSGAWSAHPGIGPPSTFHTALALLAIQPFQTVSAKQAADLAFEWLSELRGLESHWLWQWKFRLFDTQVRFDPAKSGWPWVPGTVSWVGPTALSILAFRAWRRDSPRTAPAAAMLADRACPKGGWNAGNAVVFGVDLDPHPDFTAMAVLALSNATPTDESLLRDASDYLATRIEKSSSAYSLAWAAMALSANGHADAGHAKSQLERCTAGRLERLPQRVLALAALALEDPPYAFQEARL